jgi:hypothetical protein
LPQLPDSVPHILLSGFEHIHLIRYIRTKVACG